MRWLANSRNPASELPHHRLEGLESFCADRRDDGVGYGDYLEQLLAYLTFLKMADEYARPP